jgi:hypothetical protein
MRSRLMDIPGQKNDDGAVLRHISGDLFFHSLAPKADKASHFLENRANKTFASRLLEPNSYGSPHCSGQRFHVF